MENREFKKLLVHAALTGRLPIDKKNKRAREKLEPANEDKDSRNRQKIKQVLSKAEKSIRQAADADKYAPSQAAAECCADFDDRAYHQDDHQIDSGIEDGEFLEPAEEFDEHEDMSQGILPPEELDRLLLEEAQAFIDGELI